MKDEQKKQLQSKIFVLTEVNKILAEKRAEFDRLIMNNETAIREAESVMGQVEPETIKTVMQEADDCYCSCHGFGGQGDVN